MTNFQSPRATPGGHGRHLPATDRGRRKSSTQRNSAQHDHPDQKHRQHNSEQPFHGGFLMRNYGIMSDRQRLGGVSALPATTRDEIHPRDSNLLPGSSPLKLLKVLQALRDVFTLLVWIVFGLLISFAVGGPIIALGWMLFFS